MTLNEKIKWIIENRKKLHCLYGLRIFDEVDDIDAWGYKKNYLLISTKVPRDEKIISVPFSREITVIFIEGGVWQYQYLNALPSKKDYYPLERFLDLIMWRMKRGT